MSGRLSGKRAVIVGAGQTPGQYLGNGRAIALRFAQEGAEVFLTARHRERAEETERMIHAELPNARTHVYALDITDEEQVKAMLSAANAALFLASDEARFITGAKLPVDGGSVIGRL